MTPPTTDHCLSIGLRGTIAVTECTFMQDGVVSIVRQEFDTGHTSAPVTIYDTEAHNQEF